VLIQHSTAGTNNRERRDDGPRRTRGMLSLTVELDLTDITDSRQSPVTLTPPLVAVAVDVVDVVVSVAPGPPATTVTATLALGEFSRMHYTARPFH
jgi:hypothetical protein